MASIVLLALNFRAIRHVYIVVQIILFQFDMALLRVHACSNKAHSLQRRATPLRDFSAINTQ